MPWEIAIPALVAVVFLSGVFSGCETGFYSLSPLRVDAQASAASRSPASIR